MRLWFIAARHYAFQRHWDDAYAYVLRLCPDNIPKHQETYKCHSCREGNQVLSRVSHQQSDGDLRVRGGTWVTS